MKTDGPGIEVDTSGPPEIVFWGEHMRASHWPGTTPHLNVMLDFYDPNRPGFQTARNSTVLDDRGAHVLHIQSRLNDWFLNDDLDLLLASLRRWSTGFDTVTAIGFSMGGYGVFLFSEALRATQIIAISPQCAVADDKMPFETRWAEERAAADLSQDDLAAHVRPGLKGLILYDPRKADDTGHALALKRLCPDVRLVPMPYCGHPASRVIHETETWPAFARCVSQGDGAPEALRQLRREVRARSPSWWSTVITHAFQRKRTHVILGAVERMIEMSIADAPVFFRAGVRLAELGEPQAVDVIEHAIAIAPAPPESWQRRLEKEIARFEGSPG